MHFKQQDEAHIGAPVETVNVAGATELSYSNANQGSLRFLARGYLP